MIRKRGVWLRALVNKSKLNADKKTRKLGKHQFTYTEPPANISTFLDFFLPSGRGKCPKMARHPKKGQVSAVARRCRRLFAPVCVLGLLVGQVARGPMCGAVRMSDAVFGRVRGSVLRKILSLCLCDAQTIK